MAHIAMSKTNTSHTKGIVRPLDSVGRLMIPIEARRELGIEPGDKVSIILDNERIVVEKYRNTCYICGKAATSFFVANNKKVCRACCTELTSNPIQKHE